MTTTTKKKSKKIIYIAGGLIGLCFIGVIIGTIASATRSPADKTATAVAATGTQAAWVAQLTAAPVAGTATRAEAIAQAATQTAMPTNTLAPTNTPRSTNTLAPTNTPRPTNTPAPTNTLAPTNTPKPPTATPAPVVLKGSGQTATDKVVLPSTISVARFTHNGSRNFIVNVYSGSEKDLLINRIGSYDGSRPLFYSDPVTFDIQADGAWSVTITAIGAGAQPAFKGKGDAVSAFFDPPAQGAWEISHDGQRNFIVKSHCVGGSDLVQNQIGPVSGSKMVAFSKGPCLWEVQADGNWSLAPR